MVTPVFPVSGNHDRCPICKGAIKTCPHSLAEMDAKVWENHLAVLVQKAVSKAMSASQGVQPPAPDTVALSAYARLSPAEKVQIIEAMGFTRRGSDHQSDCPYAIDAGYRCNCVPPADEYVMPRDVAKHLGQDWDSRVEASKKPRPIYEVER